MAHVMSLIFFPMSIGFMSHVGYKKRSCRPVEFKGQGPVMARVSGPALINFAGVIPPALIQNRRLFETRHLEI